MKPKAAIRSDRIAIEAQLHETYKELSSGSDVESTPFEELKDVFLIAACLGFRSGKRRPLSSDRRDIIRWETLSPETDVPVLYALAIAATGRVEVLDDIGEVLTIAEEYANEGVHLLIGNFSSQKVRPLWQLVEMLRAESNA